MENHRQANPSAAVQFDVRQFGMEVANELGVNPDNLSAYGLSEQQIQDYERNLHSRNRRNRR